MSRLVLFAAACTGDSIDSPAPPPEGSFPPQLRLITDALSRPVFATAAPADGGRLFVVEQGGQIRVVQGDSLLSAPFLDLSARISCCGERGLLGLAFDPGYAQNGQFYVSYTDRAGDSRIGRFSVGSDPSMADPESEVLVLAVPQPYSNHNGGFVAFGPDGHLYVALGDGGSAGDPDGNGQDPATLLGSLLRIAVGAGSGYSIPADNPFVGVPSVRPEIWAYGVRNPWRASFDRETGDLYVGDVGEGRLEEIDVEPSPSTGGRNYGWSTMEGTECFSPPSCDQTGFTLPVIEYRHGEGCSVTGGYVYRGAALPDLRGLYFYGDYCSGWIRSFRYRNGQATEPTDWTNVLGTFPNLTSFGEDAQGELYVMTLGGQLYRLEPDSS